MSPGMPGVGMSTQTRIETRSSMEFVGVALHGNPESGFLSEAWDLFGAVADDAGISRIGKDIYGLQIYHPDFPKRFELTYMACIKKEPEMDVPVGMLMKSLPQCRYAVQKVAGGVSGIDDVLMYLYRDFIPKSGLRVAMPIDFEKYCNVKNKPM